MSLRSEPLRGYRWAAFRRLKPESYIWAIFVGSVPSALAFVLRRCPTSLKNALEDREKINKNLLLFDIVTGDDDKIVGEDVTKFEDQLKQENVQHVYTLLPGGTHSMFVWRSALYNFLQQIFKH